MSYNAESKDPPFGEVWIKGIVAPPGLDNSESGAPGVWVKTLRQPMQFLVPLDDVAERDDGEL